MSDLVPLGARATRGAPLLGLLATLAPSSWACPGAGRTQDPVRGETLSPAALEPGRRIDLGELARLARSEGPGRRRTIGRAAAGSAGTWRIPSREATGEPRSGLHDLTNTSGDTAMGIGFGRPVRLEGVWIRGQAGPAVWARAVRALGYREGMLVARTSWFRELAAEPRWFPIELEGIDRVVFEAEPSANGGGWYALDDLSFTPGGPGQTVCLDFEDLAYGALLTGSGYAGLAWEAGSGSVQGSLTMVEQRLRPDSGSPSEPLPRPTAGGDATAPLLVASFEGTRIFDTGAAFIPPDSCGWAGIDHFVEVVNSNYSVFAKTDGSRLVEVSMNAFFATGGNPGDPRVVFDPGSQRWFVIATNFLDRVFLAVSTSDDPSAGYFTTSFLVSEGADAGKTPEYPTLGVDAEGIYVACNMFSGTATATLFALEKAPLVDPVPALGVVTAFRGLPFEGALQPCVTYGAAPGAYVVSREGTSALRLRRVDPPLASPTLVDLGPVPVPAHATPPGAPSLDSATPLDPVDHRPMNALFQAGSVWTIHGVEADSRSALRWYEIDPQAVASLQVGTIADPELSFVMGSIAVNAAGDCVMGFTGSSPLRYAGACFTGRKAGDPPGATAPVVEYEPGLDSYELVDSFGRNRWGDYSLTSVDPVDPLRFWTVQEFASSPHDHWSTSIAQLELPPFADCNDNGVDDALDISEGTSQDCDSDGVPDECQPDCDADGLPDACELDCDVDGTPDDCQSFSDCNSNGVPDPCEVDCNANGIPDECDIASGTSADVDGNGVPDECDPDCNGNGIADGIDILFGGSPDCNANEIPDECDIGEGTSEDCNENEVPDECDIASGTSSDRNANGVPDECECIAVRLGTNAPGSRGAPARIESRGSYSIRLDDTYLAVSGLPPSGHGVFLMAPAASGAGSGALALGRGTGALRSRLLRADASGAVDLRLDPRGLPRGARIRSGQTWEFRYAYRDPAGSPAGMGLSDVLAIRFCD